MSEYVTLSTLKAGKWTDGAITKFLGEPDKLARNPYSKKSPQVKLYLKERVMDAESSEEFITWFEKTKKTREKLKEAQLIIAERKRHEILAYIDGLEITIPIFEKEELLKKAVAHYNNLWSYRGKDRRAELSDNKDFLFRITVNMLRHEFSEYEDELCEIFGKVGKDLAYAALKNKVLDKIATTYPFLTWECNKQNIA